MKAVKQLTGRVSMLLLFTCLVLFLIPASETQAASEKSNALKAYNRIMQNRKSDERFSLIYLDNNSIPELVAGKDVYTYKNGSAKKILSIDGGFTKYYKKKGLLIDEYAHGNIYELTEWTHYNLYRKNKVSYILTYALTTKRSGKKISAYLITGSWKRISRTAFNNTIKKYVGSSKPQRITFRNNTVANRRKYLKYETIIAKTGTTINSIAHYSSGSAIPCSR